jgi:putative ABC transport system permease protein
MTFQDVRIAVRSLIRTPALALAGVLTLAVAIGMATSVFTIVNALLLRPLPYKQADRLAMIWSSSKEGTRGPVSYDDFEDWRRDSKTIESAAAYTAYYKPVLTGSGKAERLAALLVTHEYFKVMSTQPMLGRFFRPEEDRDGHDDVVVLSHQLWRTRFEADPNVVGRTILLNARKHTIVGVAPASMPLLPPSLADEPAQLYRPVGEGFGSGSRDGRHLETIVRLRPGVSIDQAQAEIDVRSRQMEREHPKVDAHLSARIVGLRADMTRNSGAALLSLQGAVLLLMMIACANIANLMLARSTGRSREMAVRAALGAGTRHLTSMLLAESLVMGFAGGLAGLILAYWSTAVLNAVAAKILPDAGSVSIDTQVLAFALAVSFISSLLFGMAPVWRLSSVDPDDALKSGGRVMGDHHNRLRQMLAAGQIAMALILLVAAGLIGKSFMRLRSVNPGFDPQGILTASLSLPQGRYQTDAAASQFMEKALVSLRELPGVSQAAAVSVVPLSGDFDRTGFVIEGKPALPGEQESPDRYLVTPDYFDALRIPLREGRVFDSRDDQSRTPVCVISETAARRWFPGESPIGKKIRAGSTTTFDDSPFREVVGVVGDVAQYGLGLPATPQIYMPHRQFASRYMTLIMRTSGKPELMAGPLAKAVFAVDADQPVYDVKPLEQIVSNTIAARRFGLWLLAVFALSALGLAVLGIYGVVSYSVAQRTSEFGVRIALGATPSDVLQNALGGSLVVILSGLAAGIAGSLAMSRLLSGYLFGVSATDASTFAFLALLLFAIALAACYIPARRAGKVDPIAALRYE